MSLKGVSSPVIQNAVSVAIGKNRLNAEIAFHRAVNAVRPTQKSFQCGCFVADRPHFESLIIAPTVMPKINGRSITHLKGEKW